LYCIVLENSINVVTFQPFFSTFFFNLFLASMLNQEKRSIWINLYLRSKKKVEEKG